jgi:serine/threonine protein phosphatase PrpC
MMSGDDGETMGQHRDMRCRAAGVTDPGRKRPQNQDNYLIVELTQREGAVVLRPEVGSGDGRAAAEFDLADAGVLLLVADGMGGAAGGKLASGLACSFILAELQVSWHEERERTAPRLIEHLKNAVSAANRHIRDHAVRHPELMGMGTTVTAAGVLDGILGIAQVGDSRAYLVRDGIVTQLTHDQSLVQQLMDHGIITAEEAEKSEQASVVLQALGAQPSIEVDLTSHRLCRDDWLVVCSDGLYRVVRPEEISVVVAEAQDSASVAERLVSMANERGAPDNVTVVAARFEGSDLPRVTAAYEVMQPAIPVPAQRRS